MRFRRRLILSLLFAAGATAFHAPWTAAQSGLSAGQSVTLQDGSQIDGGQDDIRTGAFHGYDPSHGVVWIDDYLYRLHPEARVDGNATKLGLVSAIEQGEMVTFFTVPDPDNPGRELIVRIIRPE